MGLKVAFHRHGDAARHFCEEAAGRRSQCAGSNMAES